MSDIMASEAGIYQLTAVLKFYMMQNMEAKNSGLLVWGNRLRGGLVSSITLARTHRPHVRMYCWLMAQIN